MLHTELIRPSIYLSQSPTLSLVLSVRSLFLNLTNAPQERSHLGSHVLMTELGGLSEWGINRSKHTQWGRAVCIDHWAAALKYNEWIQRASGDGYLPSGQIFDTQSRTLVELLDLLFVTDTVICSRSQRGWMSTICSRSIVASSVSGSFCFWCVSLKTVSIVMRFTPLRPDAFQLRSE